MTGSDIKNMKITIPMYGYWAQAEIDPSMKINPCKTVTTPTLKSSPKSITNKIEYVATQILIWFKLIVNIHEKKYSIAGIQTAMPGKEDGFAMITIPTTMDCSRNRMSAQNRKAVQHVEVEEDGSEGTRYQVL